MPRPVMTIIAFKFLVPVVLGTLMDNQTEVSLQLTKMEIRIIEKFKWAFLVWINTKIFCWILNVCFDPDSLIAALPESYDEFCSYIKEEGCSTRYNNEVVPQRQTRRCGGRRRDGRSCRNYATDETNFCRFHKPQ